MSIPRLHRCTKIISLIAVPLVLYFVLAQRLSWRPRLIRAHQGPVLTVAFSPDGKMLASGGSDKMVRLWDVGSCTPLRTLPEHRHGVTEIAFVPEHSGARLGKNGKTLVSGDWYGLLQLHDVTTGALRWAGQHYGVRTDQSILESVYAVAVSPTGNMLASGGEGTLALWHFSAGALKRLLLSCDDVVRCIIFSPDGKILLSGSRGNTIKVWDIASRKLLRVLTGHQDTVYAIAFSPDGRIAASGGYDHKVRLWNTQNWRSRRILKGHHADVKAVVFSPDSKVLATGSYDGTIKLWDIQTGQKQRTLEHPAGKRCEWESVAISPDGGLLAGGCGDGTITFWRIK